MHFCTVYTMLSWVGWAVARDRCCAWTISVVHEICLPPQPNTHTETHATRATPYYFITLIAVSWVVSCTSHCGQLRPLSDIIFKLLLEKLFVFCTRILSTHVFFCNVFCRQKVNMTWLDSFTCVCVAHNNSLQGHRAWKGDRYINF